MFLIFLGAGIVGIALFSVRHRLALLCFAVALGGAKYRTGGNGGGAGFGGSRRLRIDLSVCTRDDRK